MLPTVFIAKHADDSIRDKSRSGGIFTALSDYMLDMNGIVYGCRLTDEFEAIHDRATTKAERNSFRKSKYIQSDLKQTFRKARNDLKEGKSVLFSGTSCQIAGLKSFCKGLDSGMLICIDIICHGVPSPKVWLDYLRYSEKRYNGKVTKVEFINKSKYGWSAHYETLWIDGIEYDSKIFTHLFADHNILRPACFKCPYKSVEHPGDITIGDAWGVKEANPEFYDNKGVSLVIINNEKGKTFFDEAKKNCIYKLINIEDYMQYPLVRSYEKPKMRVEFWKDYNKMSFGKIVNKYIELNIIRRGIRKIKLLIKTRN